MPTSGGNAALEVILADYQRYHAVLAVLAGAFLLVVLVITVRCWGALRSARRSPAGATRRQLWTYTGFIVLGTGLALFLAVVLAANISTAISPDRGFAGIDQSGASFTAWVASGDPAIPGDVQEQIDARLAWQRPKAVITSILLVLAVVTSVTCWRRWIRHDRTSRPADAGLLVGGLATTGLAMLLMLMVMGNVQASLAPIAITLVYG